MYGDLAQLYLEANVISTLPIELAQFTKLETLSVSQNRCVLHLCTYVTVSRP